MKEFKNFDEYQLAEHKSLLNMCDKATMYALEAVKEKICEDGLLTSYECLELISEIIEHLDRQMKNRELN